MLLELERDTTILASGMPGRPGGPPPPPGGGDAPEDEETDEEEEPS
jgi:hypothetical protein